MYDSDNFPDDVPVADAVEQRRAIDESASDEDADTEASAEWPLEAAGPDWHDQLDTVDLDPEDGMTDG